MTEILHTPADAPPGDSLEAAIESSALLPPQAMPESEIEIEPDIEVGLQPPPGALSEVLAQRRKAMLDQLRKMSMRRGQILFDGQWLPPEEARQNYWRMWSAGVPVTAE